MYHVVDDESERGQSEEGEVKMMCEDEERGGGEKRREEARGGVLQRWEIGDGPCRARYR